MAVEPAGLWPDSVFNRQSSVILENLQRFVDQGLIYQHQADAVTELKKELERQPEGHGNLHNISLAVLPTGTGKTGVGVLAAYACNARKVLVITPSETISKQQIANFTYVFDERLNPDRRARPFLDERGIFHRGSMEKWTPIMEKWAPTNFKCVLKTREVREALRCELVVANAHKFGERTKAVNLEEINPDLFSLVIVDEAHHYPAKTWKRIVDHFESTRIIFLTATPFHGKEYILQDKRPCYKLSRQTAIDEGYIRPMRFVEVGVAGNGDSTRRLQEIIEVLQRMQEILQGHDQSDKPNKHKGMILASSTYEAGVIVALWNTLYKTFGTCASFIEKDPFSNLQQFAEPKGDVRVLVIIYRATEGFDCKHVSVVAILRNVHKESHVYFAQFVGRAVRKLHPKDPVEATVISHAVHNQRYNYDAFEHLAEVDPEDPEDP